MTPRCHGISNDTSPVIDMLRLIRRHASEAMTIALDVGAQGYVGRILSLKLDIAVRNAADRPSHLESENWLQLTIKSVALNLKSQLPSGEDSRSWQAVFEYFIPWQARWGSRFGILNLRACTRSESVEVFSSLGYG